ncbi:hypothetical protein N007_04165 [Alicyclobacillus acidoterrestris ATCC 49025]|nr:hypothetical protein N007_04165 [Alicyclobacillus acidoterrestris ATCC 49025]
MKMFIRAIAKHFGIGLATVLPFVFAIWVVVVVVNYVDGLVGQYIPYPGFHIPGTGFVLILAAITVIGLLSRIYISRVFFSWLDALFTRIPVIKSLYSTAKELVQNTFGRKGAFQQPVLVDWPDERAQVLGFITNETLPVEMDPDGTKVSVYLPNAFQFAGATVIVSRDKVKPCGLTVEQAFKFSLSAGLGHSVESVKKEDTETELPTGNHQPLGM